MTTTIKETLIELNVSNFEKKIIEDAARLSNTSLSSYILNAVLKQANYDLGNKDVISLDNGDRDNLIHTLNNPPKPNQALNNLFVNKN